MGIIEHGEYRPHEDPLAKITSLATTLWGIPALLGVTWAAVPVFGSEGSYATIVAYSVAQILTILATPVFIGQCAYVSINALRGRGEIHSGKARPFKVSAAISVAIALGAGALPLASLSLVSRLNEAPFVSGFLFFLGFLLPYVWVATVTLFIRQYGKRALWLLLEAPVAIFWPWIIAIAWSCASGRGCL